MLQRITRASVQRDSMSQSSSTNRIKVNILSNRDLLTTPPRVTTTRVQNERYITAHKYLANSNALAATAPWNCYMVAQALTTLLSKPKASINWKKAIPYISKVILRIDQHCKGYDRATGIYTLLEGFRTKIKEELVKMDSNLNKLTVQLNRATECLETVVTEIHGKLQWSQT